MLFERLKSSVEYHLKGKFRNATFVLPVNTDMRQQKAYEVAALMAGLRVDISFDAVSFMVRKYLPFDETAIPPRKQKFLALYIDLSESFTNITLMEINSDTVVQVQTLSDHLLRSEDFTFSLQNNVLQLAFRHLKLDTRYISPQNFLQLYHLFEKHKKELSSLKDAEISIDSAVLGRTFATTVAQQQYEIYCDPLLNYFEVLLEKFFTLTNYEKDQTDSLFC